jgi:hypothetical protein
VKSGLVRRTPHPRDARATLLELTRSGRAALRVGRTGKGGLARRGDAYRAVEPGPADRRPRRGSAVPAHRPLAEQLQHRPLLDGRRGGGGRSSCSRPARAASRSARGSPPCANRGHGGRCPGSPVRLGDVREDPRSHRQPKRSRTSRVSAELRCSEPRPRGALWITQILGRRTLHRPGRRSSRLPFRRALRRAGGRSDLRLGRHAHPRGTRSTCRRSGTRTRRSTTRPARRSSRSTCSRTRRSRGPRRATTTAATPSMTCSARRGDAGGERHEAALACVPRVLDAAHTHGRRRRAAVHGAAGTGHQVGVLSNTLWTRAFHEQVFERDGCCT